MSKVKQYIPKVLFFTLCMFVFNGLSGQSRTRWYISPNGATTNSGAISSPLSTVQAGVDSASSGDTIILKKGSYYPKSSISLPDLKLTIISDEFFNDPNAEIDSTFIYGDDLQSNVPVIIIKIGWSNKSLSILGLNFISIKNTIFQGLRTSSKSNPSIIKFCSFDSCQSSNPVVLVEATGNVRIEDCNFSNNQGYGYILYLNPLDDYSNPTRNPDLLRPEVIRCRITKNRIANGSDRGLIAVFGGAKVISNLIADNIGSSSTALVCGANANNDTVWIYNNTIVNNYRGIYSNPWWGGLKLRIFNNIIRSTQKNIDARIRQNGNTNKMELHFESNNISPFWNSTISSLDTSDGYIIRSVHDYTDSNFTLLNNYQLPDNSAAVGLGSNTNFNIKSLNGNAFQSNLPADLGAFESERTHSRVLFSAKGFDGEIQFNLDTILRNKQYRVQDVLDSIRIYRNGRLETVVSTANLVFSDITVDNDSLYSYVLEGVDQNGNSGALSQTVSVIPHKKPPLPDRDKVKTESGAYKVLISWPAVKSSYGPIRYKLFRRAVPNIEDNYTDTTKYELIIATTDTFFVDGLDLSNPLSNDSFYVYFLTTLDSFGSTSDNKQELLAFKYEKPGNTIFVSTSGSDSNLIASAAYPLRTLKRAVDFTRTDPFTYSNHEYNRFRDYIISLSAGTFDEKGIRIRDSNVNNIEFRGQLNQTILTSSDTNTHVFYITTSLFRGIKSFKGLTFKGIKKALWLDAGGRYIFENCRFEENGYKYGRAGSPSGGSIATHYANTTFTNCVFRNNYNSLFGLDGNDTLGGQYVRFNYCVLVDNRSLSGSMSNGKPGWPGNNQIYNSIIWNSSASVQTDISGLGLELYNCILKDDLSKRTNSAATCSKCYFLDPQFENISSGDFRLKNISPALSLGNGLFGNLPGSYKLWYNGEIDSSLVHLKDPTTDYLGNDRPIPYGSSSDLGAYESTRANTPLLKEITGSEKRIDLSWNHNAFSTIQKVYIARSNSPFETSSWSSYIIDSVNKTTFSFIDSGLTNKQSYYYRIISSNPDTGLYYVSDLFLAYPNTPLAKVDSVNGFSGSNQAYLTWLENDTATQYQVKGFNQIGDNISIDTVVSNWFRDTLLNNTKKYVVRAIDSFGVLGIASDTLAVTPLSNVWVDANYSGVLTLGTQQNPVKTVEHAYNWALPKDSIFIQAGSYRFNLVEDKGLAFISVAGIDSVFFRSKAQSEPIIKTEHSSSIQTLLKNITFDSNEFVLYNFNQPTLIDGCRFIAGHGNNGIIRGQYSHLKIQNSLFLNCQRLFYFDQKVSSLGGALLDYCTFINCDLTGTAWDHPSSSGKVHILNSILWDTSRSNIAGLMIDNEQLEFSNCIIKGVSNQYQSNFVGDGTKVRFENHSFQSASNNTYKLAPYSLGLNKGTEAYSIYPTFTWNSPEKDAFGNPRPANDSMPADLGWVENSYIYTKPEVKSLTVNTDSIRMEVKLNASDLFLDSTLLAVHIYKHGKIGLEDPVSRLYYENTQDSQVLEINNLPHDETYDLVLFVSNGLDSLSPSLFIDSVQLDFNSKNCDSLGAELYANLTESCLSTNQFLFEATNWQNRYPITRTTFIVENDSTTWSYTNKQTAIISKSYDTSTVDTVVLIVENSKGCRLLDSQIVKIYNPKSSFTITDSIQCFDKHEYEFINTSKSLGTATYSWNFDDSSYSYAVQPKKVFTQDGVYKISLVVDEKGCIDTFSQQLQVYGEPKFTIQAKDTILCGSDTLDLSLLVYNYNIDSLDILWKYSDGELDSGNNSKRYIDSVGRSSVKVILSSSISCIDSSSLNFALHSPPLAKFAIDDSIQCFSNNLFAIEDSSVNNVAYGTLKRQWIFGSDTIPDSLSVAYSFNSADSFDIRLDISHTSGCRDSLLKEVIVYETDRVLLVDSSDDDCVSSSLKLFLPPYLTKDLKSINWFVDGILVDTNDFLNYQLIDSGFHDVEVLFETDNGCIDTLRKTIYRRPSPSIQLSVDSSFYCGVNHSIEIIENIDSFTTSNIKRLYWLNDNFIDTFYGGFARQLSLNGAKIHKIKVQVLNDIGCSSSDSAFIRLIKNPVASFVSNKTSSCFNSPNIRFTSNSTFDSIQNRLHHSWEMGSSYILDSNSVNYKFSTLGSNGVKLIVKDSFGCIDSITKTIKLNPNPNLYLSSNTNILCTNKRVKFKLNDSFQNLLSDIKWFMAGKLRTNVDSLTWISDTTSKVSATIIAKNKFGCVDTLREELHIFPTPKTKVFKQLKNQCLKDNILFVNDSSTIDTGIILKQWISYSSVHDSIPFEMQDSTSVRFLTSGNLNLWFISEADNGCKDSMNATVRIYEHPDADFNINRTEQCLNENKYVFVNRSISNLADPTLFYEWNFGDNLTSSSKDDTITYSSANEKKIRLKVLNKAGCSDTVVQSIKISPNPIAKIDASDSVLCLKTQTYQLTDVSSINGTDSLIRYWLFDDLTVVTDSIVKNKKFVNPGNHWVDLISVSSLGCRDTLRKNLFISEEPVADFVANSYAQCLVGNKFKFTNTTAAKPTSGTSTYLWSFGDGNSTSNYSPSYSYSTAKSYTVRLKAISSYGCESTKSRQVAAVPNPPIVFDTISDISQCVNGNEYRISIKPNTSSYKQKYRWYFGSNLIGTTDTFINTFNTHGTKPVKVVVENSLGCKDSNEINLMVREKPISSFTVNNLNQCETRQLFNFNNNSSISSKDSIVQYEWRINDSLVSVNQQFTNYKKTGGVGSELISLMVRSSFGCRDTLKRTIYVRPRPTAKFTVNDSAQCYDGNKFKFTNKSSIVYGSLSFLWEYDARSFDTTFNGEYSYNQYGEYNPLLIAKSDFGCLDTFAMSLTVYSEPLMDFYISDSAMCLYQNKFTITGNATNPDSVRTTYYWESSSAQLDTSKTVTRSYQSTGIKSIKYIGETEKGCQDSVSKEVRIYEQPKPNFVVTPKSQCLRNNNFVLKNTSSIDSKDSLIYFWKFGDDDSSTNKNTSHSYIEADTFRITLIAKSLRGCLDSLSNEVFVHPDPKLALQLHDSNQCLNANVFKPVNQSTIKSGSIGFAWDFGNGLSSTSKAPSWRYKSSGDYKVLLIGTSDFGCTDSLESNVSVFAEPELDFTVNNYEQCLRGNEFLFVNNSKISNADTIRYEWRLGTDTVDNITSPRITFKEYGSQLISLIGRTEKGCIDTLMDFVSVYPNPYSDFKFNDSIQCLSGNDFVLEGTSSIAFGNIGFIWNFGDGNSSDKQIARHTYQQDGFYKVELVSRSDFGCTDTMTKMAKVTQKPTVNISTDTLESCLRGNEFKFINNSTFSGTENVTYTWFVNDGKEGSSDTLDFNFLKSGIFRLALMGVTDENCIDSQSLSVIIHPQGESSIVNIDSNGCLFGNRFNFGNNSRVAMDKFVLFSWDYGNGYIDTVFNRSPQQFSYGKTGIYTVRLISQTLHGCMDTSETDVQINPMPESRVENNQLFSCLNDQKEEFIDISDTLLSKSNRWIFNDVTINDQRRFQPNADIPGDYSIKLVSYTQFGCSDTAVLDYTVYPLPQSKIVVNRTQQCLETNEFHFDNLYREEDNVIWDFDDGSFGSGKSITQYFVEDGIYAVSMLTENEFGCTSADTLLVEVYATPEAQIEIEEPCLGQLINIDFEPFINRGDIKEYRWNMGDGGFYFDSIPKHRYQFTGRYGLNLKMYSDKGCLYVFEDSVDVYPNPEAYFTKFTGRPTILNNRVGFRDESYGSNINEWDFGDNSDLVFDELEVYHNYEDTGNYKVRLVVGSYDYCYDTSYYSLYVWPDYNILFPSAFSPNEDGVNDAYHIRGNFHSVKFANWIVYTEGGVEVFKSNDIMDEWNGKLFNVGDELPMGTYQVVLMVVDDYDNRKSYSSKLNLIR